MTDTTTVPTNGPVVVSAQSPTKEIPKISEPGRIHHVLFGAITRNIVNGIDPNEAQRRAHGWVLSLVRRDKELNDDDRRVCLRTLNLPFSVSDYQDWIEFTDEERSYASEGRIQRMAFIEYIIAQANGDSEQQAWTYALKRVRYLLTKAKYLNSEQHRWLEFDLCVMTPESAQAASNVPPPKGSKTEPKFATLPPAAVDMAAKSMTSDEIRNKLNQGYALRAANLSSLCLEQRIMALEALLTRREQLGSFRRSSEHRDGASTSRHP